MKEVLGRSGLKKRVIANRLAEFAGAPQHHRGSITEPVRDCLGDPAGSLSALAWLALKMTFPLWI